MSMPIWACLEATNSLTPLPDLYLPSSRRPSSLLTRPACLLLKSVTLNISSTRVRGNKRQVPAICRSRRTGAYVCLFLARALAVGVLGVLAHEMAHVELEGAAVDDDGLDVEHDEEHARGPGG